MATSRSDALDALLAARIIAEHAERYGFRAQRSPSRPIADHLGAALADSILQAGLNYRTVVRPRVDRIRRLFPEAATLPGTANQVMRWSAADFLLWRDSTKIDRFLRLLHVLQGTDIVDAEDLRDWLQRDPSRDVLLSISGIGPKTVDYLSCLVGVDCIAVDRHVRVFAANAGLTSRDYDALRTSFSFAADLLGSTRREFDSWIWEFAATRASPAAQMNLL